MSDNKKKRKAKNEYYDDGRTISDMSMLGGAKSGARHSSISSYREKLRTYFESVKLMILPMVITLALIGVAFLLLYLLLSLA